MKNTKKTTKKNIVPQDIYVECEVLRGLKSFAVKEIKRLFGDHVSIIADTDEESVKCFFAGDARKLLGLRTVVAVYAGANMRIPGPQALVLPHNFQYVISLIKFAESLHGPRAFTSIRFNAAGDDSPLFKKLGSKISKAASLKYDPRDGDHMLRIRPTEYGEWGWDVLVRLSPRPLSARGWRVANMPGAVNATIASAMVTLTNPQASDSYINLMCGSGTLLIERAQFGKPKKIVGIDSSSKSLAMATTNMQAAGFAKDIELQKMDATALRFPDASFNKIVADVPWGQLIGTHTENNELYPALLREAARIGEAYADFIVLTHDIARFETILQVNCFGWKVKAVYQISQGGKHPKIYHLKKS